MPRTLSTFELRIFILISSSIYDLSSTLFSALTMHCINCSWLAWLFAIIRVFLAPTGAQGVKMCVRPCVRPAHYAQEGNLRGN